MESYLHPGHYDLITPDGVVKQILSSNNQKKMVIINFHHISPAFTGFKIPLSQVHFNLKSTLAQLGLHSSCQEIELDINHLCAQARVTLHAMTPTGIQLLPFIKNGSILGKLFAADDRRKVRTPDYLSRMFGRCDRYGRPLLSLGGLRGSKDLLLEVVNGRTIAYLSLLKGIVKYPTAIKGLIDAVGRALTTGQSTREFLPLYQEWSPNQPRITKDGEILLVKTLPLHIRTVFARIAGELLTDGYEHTSADILQPDTENSGDIYELFGESKQEITDIPLEFYTLEAHREYVFFEDRDQLQSSLDSESALFDAFKTAPQSTQEKVAVFIVKGTQLLELREDDWIQRRPLQHDLPGHKQINRQAQIIDRYIQQQPSAPFLKAIEDDLITSQGILLCRHLPSPLLKRLLLSIHVQRCLKGIYFQHPSLSSDLFFSQEDRALFNDLYQFGIPLYWVDDATKKILKYVQQADLESGMFVPLAQIDNYLKATVFGIYGSNLIEGAFEDELTILLEEILALKETLEHPLLNSEKPLALITGGGPGAMAIGNRVAKNLNILSCANIMDFRPQKDGEMLVNEQKANPHIEAKMTYRLKQLVERQSEFNLHFPIFLPGGFGTDFEFTLEEVRRKVGAVNPTPVILFGPTEYWTKKITSRFHCNLEAKTIVGSEWLSNCFYVVQNAQQALKVYKKYFNQTLITGKEGAVYSRGFVDVAKDFPE